MIKLKKLTEEEIQELPFPETARLLGGILVFEPILDKETIEKLRKAFNDCIKDV